MLLPHLADRVEMASDLLIANSAKITDQRFAGRGLGRWLAAEAIAILAPASAVVVAYASPMGGPYDDTERGAAQAKLRRVWKSIGFEHVGGSIVILDTSRRTFENHLWTRRRAFGVA